jgi:diacylglycerol kinase family enzyme
LSLAPAKAATHLARRPSGGAIEKPKPADDPTRARVELKDRRIGILLNTSSGSCDVNAEDDLEASLVAAGLKSVHIWCGPGGNVDTALQEVARSELDVLVVLGGDGTIRATAEACGAGGPLLIPLPGGTLNRLPRALYGARPWRQALRDTLAAPVVQLVHGGSVGGHLFCVSAIFGGPTRMAEAREAIREHNLTKAIEKGMAALRRAGSTDLHYRFGTQAGVADIVAVRCPLALRRLDPEEVVLESVAIKLQGPVDALGLVLSAAFRDWRDDPTFAQAKLGNIDISSDQSIPALLDGEPFTLGGLAHVDVVRGVFKALRPARMDD